MMIEIPFKEYFKDTMLSGLKTATSRTKKMGNAGDTFPRFGATFQIDAINLLSLREIAGLHFKEEGFENSEGFLEVWAQIHPRQNLNLDRKVWFHTFHKLKD